MDHIEIQIGARFNSFEEFKTALDRYEKKVFGNLVIVKSKVDRINEDLRYVNVRYKCKFHGSHTKTTHRRNTSTYKQGCKSHIVYILHKNLAVELMHWRWLQSVMNTIMI